MLEIVAVILLCRVNWNNALERGRNPRGFMLATVGLWVGFELLGAYAGQDIDSAVIAYIVALFFGTLGGLASYVIAKICEEGTYAEPGYAPPKNRAIRTEALFPGTALETKVELRRIRFEPDNLGSCDSHVIITPTRDHAKANGAKSAVVVESLVSSESPSRGPAEEASLSEAFRRTRRPHGRLTEKEL